MEVVVARIGRPHGMRGEVSVEVRTDEPERRFAPGTRCAPTRPPPGPLTIADGRVHCGPAAAARSTGYDDRDGAEACADVLLVADVDPAERPEDPDEFYDHQLVGLAVRTVDRRAGRRGRRGAAPAGPGPARVRRPGRRRGAGAVRRGDRARGRPRRAGRSWSTRRPGCSTDVPDDERPASSDVRIDVVTIFPDYLAPLRLSLIGKAVERRAARPARPRPARLDRRPAPHRRRHAVRRRGRAW